MITFKFETEEEKNAIIMENREKKLSKVMYLKDGNFLVFEEMPFIYELENKISILEAENENLKEGLRAVLRGDMQSLAYILYPEDFNTFRK